MDVEELKETLEQMSNRELFRYLRRLLCGSLNSPMKFTHETNFTLDIIFGECHRRGKERLYDKTYETVCSHPEVCNTAQQDQVEIEKTAKTPSKEYEPA